MCSPMWIFELRLTSKVVVDRDSAVLGLPGHRERVIELDRDHREICKFEDGPEFTRVARHLKRIAEDAIGNITPVCTPGGNGSLSLTTPQSYSSDAVCREMFLALKTYIPRPNSSYRK